MKEYNFILDAREQPAVVRASLQAADTQLRALADEYAGKIHRIVLTGCGDPYMMGVGAAYALEGWGGILTEAIEAAEFLMYRLRALDAGTLVIPMSSSGKSLTVVEAAQASLERGAQVLALTNTVPSPLATAAPNVLQTQAGPTNAYPTKTTTTALALLYSLALFLAALKHIRTPDAIAALRDELYNQIPDHMRDVLSLEASMSELARQFVHAPMYTFLGSGTNLATALLAAAKMVETSQSNARATNLEEFSHLYGYTLAQGEPVFILSRPGTLAQRGALLAQNIRANGGKVIVVGTVQDRGEWGTQFDAFIEVPMHNEMFAPLLTALPLQLFAYYVSIHRGRNPDKPARVGSDYIQQIIYGGLLEGYDKR